jgi:hypothetical protein
MAQIGIVTLEAVDDDAQLTKLADRRSRLMHTLLLRWEPEVETWIYDDSEIGVFGEPFVSGADKMLTQLRAIQVGPGLDPFRLVFSASPFPGALEARRLDDEDGGVWYEAKLADRILTGWLCAHFFDYFASAPPSVYVKAESLH